MVRVSAKNSLGYGDASEEDDSPRITVATVPLAPNAPTNDGSSDSELSIEWSGATSSNNGGSSILEHELDMAESDGSWETVLASSLATSFTKSSGVESGSTYTFRLRYRNVYGWGPYSSSLEIVAGSVPSKPSMP